MPCRDDRAKCELPPEFKRFPGNMLNGSGEIVASGHSAAAFEQSYFSARHEQMTHGREGRQGH
jgi:hypothetical protein